GAVGGRMQISGRQAKTIGPPDRGSVEDEVVLGSWVDCRGVSSGRVPAFQTSASDDFQARDRSRIAVPLPTNQAFDPVAILHAPSREYPVLLVDTNPICPTGDGEGAAGADQHRFVGAIVF